MFVELDITGREVRVLLNQSQPAGSHHITFDSRDLASGVYLYRLQAGDPSRARDKAIVETRKMVLMR